MIENEYLPLGHPITHDIDIDIDQLRTKISEENNRLRTKP